MDIQVEFSHKLVLLHLEADRTNENQIYPFFNHFVLVKRYPNNGDL